MNNRAFRLFLSLTFLSILLNGCCAPKSLFVLLPSPDGHAGKVSVKSDGGETALSKAYESTGLSSSKERPYAPVVLTEDQVNTLFKDALAAQPAIPVTYLLYFDQGLAALTAESEKLLPAIIEYIRASVSTDVSVTGHSDRVGSKDINVRISKERADYVAKRLSDLGVPPSSLQVASHGFELPLVDTPAEVPEPRNRRVEVVVR